MNFSSGLPYTAEVYAAAMADYNVFWFPGNALLVLATAGAVALAARGGSRRNNGAPARERASITWMIGVFLAAGWLWVGAAHQLERMAALNFMAPYYGAAFAAEGALLVLCCVLRRHKRFDFRGDARGRVGLAVALFGLLVYPLLALASGVDWRAVPLAGLAPEPTTIVTVGILLGAREKPPLYLFVVPLAWGAVAGVTAYLLAFPLDYAVPATIVIAAGMAVHARIKNPPPQPNR